jgi:hypothetical protein
MEVFLLKECIFMVNTDEKLVCLHPYTYVVTECSPRTNMEEVDYILTIPKGTKGKMHKQGICTMIILEKGMCTNKDQRGHFKRVSKILIGTTSESLFRNWVPIAN